MRAINKKDFCIRHAKSFAKVFAFFYIAFTWLFEAGQFGSLFWASFFAGFFTVGGIYLSVDDLVSDEDVLARIYSGVK